MKAPARYKSLVAQLQPGELQFDDDSRKTHSGDKWYATHLPDAVAFPKNTESVSRILQFAHRHRIPVTPRGAGYGYVGGCVPVNGGISLSLAHLNRILEISPTDFVAVVEPGVKTEALQIEVEKLGLFYPPDPASKKDCSLGGNIATNAGGPRCLKYGVTRDYVLGVEVVLPDGAIVTLGSRTHKNKTGFDLHRLFVGSEGLLGIVTQATLKLLPLPPFRACLGVGFRHMRHATRAIQAVFAAGYLPSALELADAFTLAAARRRTGTQLLDGCNAHFIIELDGQEPSVRRELPALAKLLNTFNPVFIQKGFGADGCEKFWALRREFSFSLRDTGLTKLNEDVVVPRSRLNDLFTLAETLQKKYRIPIACFGHAGDGNIHVNLMLDPTDNSQKQRSELALDELFREVLNLGGAVTGEHGIGLAKLPWWPLAASPTVRSLHNTVKLALDPHLILNPGKFTLPPPNTTPTRRSSARLKR